MDQCTSPHIELGVHDLETNQWDDISYVAFFVSKNFSMYSYELSEMVYLDSVLPIERLPTHHSADFCTVYLDRYIQRNYTMSLLVMI